MFQESEQGVSWGLDSGLNLDVVCVAGLGQRWALHRTSQNVVPTSVWGLQEDRVWSGFLGIVLTPPALTLREPRRESPGSSFPLFEGAKPHVIAGERELES